MLGEGAATAASASERPQMHEGIKSQAVPRLQPSDDGHAACDGAQEGPSGEQTSACSPSLQPNPPADGAALMKPAKRSGARKTSSAVLKLKGAGSRVIGPLRPKSREGDHQMASSPAARGPVERLRPLSHSCAGLPYATTEQAIREFFSDLELASVRFVYEPDGRPSGLVSRPAKNRVVRPNSECLICDRANDLPLSSRRPSRSSRRRKTRWR